MKTFYRILTQGCVICTAITVAFCLFIKCCHTLSEAAMTLTQYLIILLFSLLVAGANQLFRLPVLPLFAKLLIHCAALCLAFCAVFIGFSKITVTSPSVVFAVIFIFIFVYAVIAGAVFGIRRLCRRKQTSDPEKPYRPLYK